jgi:tRNA 2-selenouridine synthase
MLWTRRFCSLLNIASSQFAELLCAGVPILDVRAPIEFSQGSIPGSFNFPLLTDDERAEVGIVYKLQGQAAAITRGHQLVNTSTRAVRTAAWVQFAHQNPQTIITCFRGGLRSQTVQNWLQGEGLFLPVVEGGYKALRQFLLQNLEAQSRLRSMTVITGPTGSGKTEFLRRFPAHALDLEDCAQHRGSAFGARPGGQPAQIDFENQISLRLLKMNTGQLLVEDESRMIGQRVLPPTFFAAMNAAEALRLESSLNDRVERILEDYVKTPLRQNAAGDEVFSNYLVALSNIQKRLGGALYLELKAVLESCRQDFLNRSDLENNRVWIEKLLLHYYDPVYERGISRRKSLIIFRGTHEASAEFLASKLASNS